MAWVEEILTHDELELVLVSLSGMVGNPSPSGEEKFQTVAMRRYRLGAHTKTDPKVHLVWIPKYRKHVLRGEVAVRTRDLLRQIAAEHKIEIITGKVSADHVHMLMSYRPTQSISKIVQWLKGISSQMLLAEFAHLRRQFWGKHSWARGYLAVSSGNVTDEMIQAYIDEQEDEPMHDDRRFPIDESRTPRLIDAGRSVHSSGRVAL